MVGQLFSDVPGFSLSGVEMTNVPGRVGLAMASGPGSGAVDETALSLLSEDEFSVRGQVVGYHEFTIRVEAGP